MAFQLERHPVFFPAGVSPALFSASMRLPGGFAERQGPFPGRQPAPAGHRGFPAQRLCDTKMPPCPSFAGVRRVPWQNRDPCYTGRCHFPAGRPSRTRRRPAGDSGRCRSPDPDTSRRSSVRRDVRFRQPSGTRHRPAGDFPDVHVRCSSTVPVGTARWGILAGQLFHTRKMPDSSPREGRPSRWRNKGPCYIGRYHFHVGQPFQTRRRPG